MFGDIDKKGAKESEGKRQEWRDVCVVVNGMGKVR